MPVFLHDEELIGYTTIKGHWLDIGGKEPYSTDTVDVFQEGTIFPGVKLYARGELRQGHLPDGARELAGAEDGRRRHQRRGRRRAHRRRRAAAARRALRARDVPDLGRADVRPRRGGRPQLLRAASRTGATSASGEMDNNGFDDEPVPFEVVLEVDGSTVRLDYSNAPRRAAGADQLPDPVDGVGEPDRDHDAGRRRRVAERGPLPRRSRSSTRPGSMFHPIPPSPCFLYGWPAMQAMEVIYDAISKALPDGRAGLQRRRHLRARVVGRRARTTGEPWADGSPHPVGQGASVRGGRREQPHPPRRGGDAFLADRGVGVEEPVAAREGRARARLRRRRAGTAAGSASTSSSMPARTCTSRRRSSGRRPRRGGSQAAARAGRTTSAITSPDGTRTHFGKATRLQVPKGSTLELYTAAAAATAPRPSATPRGSARGRARGLRHRGARAPALSARLR